MGITWWFYGSGLDRDPRSSLTPEEPVNNNRKWVYLSKKLLYELVNGKSRTRAHLVLGHVPAGLHRLVPEGFLEELKSQARVRRDVHQQLDGPVREETLPAELTAELRVNMDDLHPAENHRETPTESSNFNRRSSDPREWRQFAVS